MDEILNFIKKYGAWIIALPFLIVALGYIILLTIFGQI